MCLFSSNCVAPTSSSSSRCCWCFSSSSPTSKFLRPKAGPSMRSLQASGRGEPAKATRHLRSSSTLWGLTPKCEEPSTQPGLLPAAPRISLEHRQLDESDRSQASRAWRLSSAAVKSRGRFRTSLAPGFLMKARLLLRSIQISSRFYNFFITDFVIFFFISHSPISTL